MNEVKGKDWDKVRKESKVRVKVRVNVNVKVKVKVRVKVRVRTRRAGVASGYHEIALHSNTGTRHMSTAHNSKHLQHHRRHVQPKMPSTGITDSGPGGARAERRGGGCRDCRHRPQTQKGELYCRRQIG